MSTDTTEFSKGLKQAEKETETFGRSLVRMGAIAAGAFAAFEAAKGLGSWALGTIEGVAATKDMAERIGLSVEALGRLSYAAKLAGMDQEELVKSLEQMQKRLGEVAIEGSGPAADALKRYGLSARELASAGPEQALTTIIKMMEGITNAAERAKVATDLFGKSGIGMISLAAAGSASLKELGAEALAVGAAVDNITGEKIGELDDSIDRMKMSFSGLGNTIMGSVAPAITWTVNLLTEGIKLARVAFLNLGGAAVQVFAAIVDAASVFNSDWKNIAEGMHETSQKMFADASKTWQSLGSSFGAGTMDAEKRAKIAAAKAAAFRAPGELSAMDAKKTAGKEDKPFAGALELGSKEAYSAIVQARLGTTQSDQRQIAANTQRAAGAGERSVALLEQIANAAGKAKPLTPHMAGAV